MKKYIKKIKLDKGAALLIAVVFFMLSSTAVIGSIVSPVSREYHVSSQSYSSKQSYYLAESGVEDALYRLQNRMTISNTETISLNSSSATTTITDAGLGIKNILSTGNVSNYQRKISAAVNVGSGLSFTYGIQAGDLGLSMGQSTVVNGSVYSNGNISGGQGSNASVTGSATAANSIASSADQQNGSGTPAYNITLNQNSNTTDIAQSFQVSTSGRLSQISLYLKKIGSPSNGYVYIVNNNNGLPSNNYLTRSTVSASLVSTTYGWVNITFSTNPQLSTNTTYWIVFDGGSSHENYYTIGANASYNNGTSKIGNYYRQEDNNQNIWNANNPSNADIFFKVFLNGGSGSIDNINVGTNNVGNTYAHSVTNSNIAGTNYCQTGSHNNKSCNTSLADSPPIGFPISDQNIADWENDALTGGTINGNYTINSNNVSLGPKKIVGDLVVDNGHTLSLTGNIWVTGNLIVDNSATIQPSSSYGASSVAIIVNGTVTVQRYGNLQNSGTVGSYVLTLTTSTCPSGNGCDNNSHNYYENHDNYINNNNAINLASHVDAGILYAANGTITTRRNAYARQITGYGISLGSSSELVYDSGLINQNFIGGPSGAWTINGWGESQ